MAQHRFRIAAALLLFAGLAWTGPVSAQPFPPSPPDQRRAVGGWLVVHEPDEDGRIVRLVRAHDDMILEYYASYWRGNPGPFRHAVTARGGQGCAAEDWREDPEGRLWLPVTDVAAAARQVRVSMARSLIECGALPEEAEAALQGFERAYAAAAAFAEEARTWTLGVIQSIENYPTSIPTEN